MDSRLGGNGAIQRREDREQREDAEDDEPEHDRAPAHELAQHAGALGDGGGCDGGHQ